MRSYHIPSLILMIGVIALLPACSRFKSKNERLQLQWNAKTKEVNDLLAGVKDVPSAKAAEPKLAAALKDLEKIGEKLEKHYDSEDVDPGEREPMTEAVAAGIAEMQREAAEVMRISKNPELVAALGETWKKIPSVVIMEATRSRGGAR